MKKEIIKFQYGNKFIYQEVEELENGNKKVISRTIKGKITNKYDNVKPIYCLFPKEELNLREFFELIVGDRFEQKDFVIEVYNGYEQIKHCSSLEELMRYSKWADHFVPNTFYKWQSRSIENLRCIQWMLFDFELRKSNGQAFTPVEIWEIFRSEIGFMPTFIKESKTPGSYHVALKHTSINGKLESTYLFKRIQKKIADIIGTDDGAIGANHNYSIPKNGKRVFYFGDNTIDFNDLKNWWIGLLKESNKSSKTPRRTGGKVTSITEHLIWNHAAVQALQNQEFEGSRNEAGFTLALLHYALGIDQKETAEYLLEKWFPLVSQEGQKYHLSALKASIRSAYSKKYRGPSKEKIEALTGIEFNIRVFRGQYKRQLRHNKNENQQAIINYLREHKGKVTMVQTDLIKDICKTQKSPLGKKFSIDSIKRNLRGLKKLGFIDWQTKGSGGNTKDKAVEFVLKDGIQSNDGYIIEEDHNVYVYGEKVN
ncbi:hypothetical protein [Planococcus notacanthi]|uniref:Primase C-terminal 1 domain-containing protein n=1 Tax=Planococcus notacanthi TaxID=3035188 RepID=A0ABT7ZQF3_9BACL|nr:hypothetical protein [Planococcus sp. APC 4016]MDN3429163.1 hypothetical protein [Planococcus sp. APC 4016]